SGSAPNRIFNIEYRTSYYGTNTMLNYEVRLFEGQTAFDVIYGTIVPLGAANDSALTVGVQKNTGLFTSVGCDPTGGQSPFVTSGQLYHYTLAGGTCPTPTPSPTATPSPGACIWTAAPVYPVPILDEPATTVGSNLYTFSGVSNGAIPANSYKFNGTTWTPIMPLPLAVE